LSQGKLGKIKHTFQQIKTIRVWQHAARMVFVLAWVWSGISGCGHPDGQTETLLPASPQPTITPHPPTLTSSAPISVEASVIPIVSATPTPKATATPTHPPPSPTVPPPPLEVFTHSLLRVGVIPQTYITDPCEQLRLRWGADKAEPGTIVVPIMFHGIRSAGKTIAEGDDISITEEQFNAFILYAKNLGFETITSQQLRDFLYENRYIPPRSMILIVDDRRPGTVEEYFLPALQANNWTVTLGWIIGDTNDTLWARMEQLNNTGLLDVQSHGYLHRYIIEGMPEETIREEVAASIPILEAHFGKKPIAFVWPGGNFVSQAASIAREVGYQLAFTAYSRGPLMFNWIPQGEPERAVGDPLMTLPRFWSTDVTLPLDTSIQIGDAARTAALDAWTDEAAYYQIYCGGQLKP
jgi:peptidoglycan/xylan/chitin deacetylase (PgdA/CDA1 family)